MWPWASDDRRRFLLASAALVLGPVAGCVARPIPVSAMRIDARRRDPRSSTSSLQLNATSVRDRDAARD
jgi:hypothetical protein